MPTVRKHKSNARRRRGRNKVATSDQRLTLFQPQSWIRIDYVLLSMHFSGHAQSCMLLRLYPGGIQPPPRGSRTGSNVMIEMDLIDPQSLTASIIDPHGVIATALAQPSSTTPPRHWLFKLHIASIQLLWQISLCLWRFLRGRDKTGCAKVPSSRDDTGIHTNRKHPRCSIHHK